MIARLSIWFAAILIAGGVLLGCAASKVAVANKTLVLAVDGFATGADMLEQARVTEENSLETKVKSGAETVDDATKEYQAWMAKAVKAEVALVTLFDSLKAASHVVAAVASGSTGDVQSAMGDVFAALQDVAKALTDLGIKVPGIN